MKFLKLFALNFFNALRFYKMQWRVWRKYRFFLPRSSMVLEIQNIQIGSHFACGPCCQILCQDKNASGALIIGDWVALNSNVMINADNGGKIYIGNNVIVGPNAVLRAANHSFNSMDLPIRRQEHLPGVIHLEEDVWLGAGVIVLPNIRIGRGAVIGAGSVVNRDIPPFSVAAGIPAQVIKKRDGCLAT